MLAKHEDAVGGPESTAPAAASSDDAAEEASAAVEPDPDALASGARLLARPSVTGDESPHAEAMATNKNAAVPGST